MIMPASIVEVYAPLLLARPGAPPLLLVPVHENSAEGLADAYKAAALDLAAPELAVDWSAAWRVHANRDVDLELTFARPRRFALTLRWPRDRRVAGLLPAVAGQGVVFLALLPSKSEIERVMVELSRGDSPTLMRSAIAGNVDCGPLSALTGNGHG